MPACTRAAWPTVVMIAMLVATPARSSGGDSPVTVSAHQATAHPMRYHLSLPVGWSASRDWPVLVVVPAAQRDFEANLGRFMAARKDRPFILVAPEVLSCGGARSRTPDHYSYSPAEWDSLQRGDDFAFEDAGLAAVLADVRRQWHGEAKAFLTGWEAGGHTVWAQAFRHPERWRGVAPVTTNYQRRGLGGQAFSQVPERAGLAIQVFRCGAPAGVPADAMKFLDQQTALALQDARDHGFKPQAVRVVAGADHGPLPGEVLAWCDSLSRR